MRHWFRGGISYEGAIKAADDGDADRLVLCLRGQKPLDADRDQLATFIGKKLRRRLWPRWLVDALSRPPTEDDYDLLADLVAQVGRKRGQVADAPATPCRSAGRGAAVTCVGADRRTAPRPP